MRTTTPRRLLVGLLTLSAVTTAALAADQFAQVSDPGWTSISQYSWAGAWGDYDRDGFIDLFVANTSTLSDPGTPCLYRNNGDGTFTQKYAIEVGPIVGGGNAAPGGYWGDLNNDGHLDLFLPNFGPNNCYLNLGNGAFTAANAGDLTKPSQPWGWGNLVDYDQDGWLDAFSCTAGGPNGARTNLLYHGLGDLRFERVTQGPVVSDQVGAGQFSNDSVWSDFDNDGDPDLLVANYGVGAFFYRNDGRGQFTRLTNSILEELQYPAGHHAWGDYDNDGDLDVVAAASVVRLFQNNTPADFNLVTSWDVNRNVGVSSASWVDYDNDGHLDLALAQGQGSPKTLWLLRNTGDGTFEQVEDAFTRTAGRWLSVAWGDYDNDGFADLFVANALGQNELFRNLGNENSWLRLRLEGRIAYGSAIGAKVRVQATIGGRSVWQMREVSGGNMAYHDPRPLFGLGDATVAERVIIEWPSGNVTELTDQAVNQTLSITETASITPVRPSGSLNGSVTLSRSGPKLQWRFEGVDLPGQTQNTLVLTNLTAEQAGRYSVVVDNGTTLVTNFTYLTVDPTFTKITEGSPVTDLGCSWGAAWGDYDEDGYPDLFVARNNLGHAAVYRGQSGGTFTTVPGLPFSDALDAWASGAWADFDQDGRQDLLVTRFDNKPAFLYFNDGDGGFSSLPINTLANWGIALADYDRDGLLDVLFSTGVTANGSAPAILYRNDGQRGFVRMSAAEVGPLVTLATFGAAIWADYDDDGWMDVYCPHWRGTDALFRNDGTGRFVSVQNAVTQGGQSLAGAGAWGDYDNDGRLDLCAVSWGGPVRVYRNLGNGEFELVDIGVTLSGAYDSAYWIDYDNDGFLDLFVAGQGGNVLYRQSGQGAFSRIQLRTVASELPANGAYSYSALWFDYDNNGFLDLYVSNGNDPRSVNTANFLYRNNGNDNGWLKVKLIGTTSNRDGIGAKVRMLPFRERSGQRRDISGGDGYNGNQLYAHFGLGSATSVSKLRIEWPSGIVQELQNLPAKQMITVIEPHLQGAFDGAGAFRIAVTCDAHRSYGLEVSTDLVEWTNVANFTEGSGVYTEDLPDTQRRFYRLR